MNSPIGSIASVGPTPQSAPLDMPTQDLTAPAPRSEIAQSPLVYLARFVAFGGAAAITVYGFVEMNLVFSNESSTVLQTLLLVLFTITFGWIALSATQAFAAAIATRAPKDADEAPLTTRTAIIMPVYNENPAATCAALQAMAEDITAKGENDAFEIFILSDTTNPEVWTQETACFIHLRDTLAGKMSVWYRRRAKNIGRKAGNLRDFIEGWGGRYDLMLVLDADSLMSADTIVTLTRRMQANPRLGILQTVPVLMGGTTLFARIQQFAGRVYGPIIARGVSAWQGRDGNYWGHNAIIRVPAFAACCGMPELPGRMPFGGHVMSHDFVEAALIRKGGFEVRMDTDLGGSWEGSPQSLLDLAARDRRWAQGNLQHAKLVGTRGLTWSNRAHFLIGIGSYLMSTLWLAMLLVGGMLTVQSLMHEQSYFDDVLQLFPQWPVFDSVRMTWLFALSMGMLFLPKVTGVIRAILVPKVRRSFGGVRFILGGALLEILLSALLAPILMFFQVQQLFEILSGRDSGWAAQSRDASDMPWAKALGSHWKQMVVGLAALVAVLIFVPNQIYWLAPVLIGLVLAPAVSRYTARIYKDRFTGLLSIPEDIAPPEVSRRTDDLQTEYAKLAISPLRVMTDLHDADTHVASLPAPSVLAVGTVNLDAATARAKLELAKSADQGIGWLTKSELTALLSDADLLMHFAKKFS
ncbi:MAG: glucans biosynthesis glucosyltransferase MdoH [Sulfitobacter sp.]